MTEKLEEVKRSAQEVIDSFVEASKDLPEMKETYYSQEIHNIVRSDGEPTSEEERAPFRKKFISNMPKSDDQGNLKVEVARWAER
jgi:predicted Asp-tRNA(Asn)/Glu-tRNA(Gln) amidotransferase subunit C